MDKIDKLVPSFAVDGMWTCLDKDNNFLEDVWLEINHPLAIKFGFVEIKYNQYFIVKDFRSKTTEYTANDAYIIIGNYYSAICKD